MRKIGMWFLGAVLGGLVGGGLGLLLAPKTGRMLRGDISDYTHHVRDEVAHAAEQRRIQLKEELNRMQEPVSEL